ncbi:hypothetical protein [Kitasatospora sp. NPDC056531]|uniref:hypothetical protein n=1 Tax=Kitasatospora sp. NPDC056531 TaxID=3345856 RepID=UPI00369D8554
MAGAVVAVAATPFVPAGVPVLLALVGLLFAGRPGVKEAEGPEAAVVAVKEDVR